jgi:hypothetical protein
MKQCPSCTKFQSDDEMILCPYDGTPLLEASVDPNSLAETIKPAKAAGAETAIMNVQEDQAELKKAVSLPPSLTHLQGEALRIIIEQPKGWEYLLFSQVLSDEIARHKQLKMDFSYGFSSGKRERVEGYELPDYIQKRTAEARHITGAVEPLLNTALPEAFGPPGVAGDPERIVYVSQKLADVYRRAIQWTLDFRALDVDEDFANLVRVASRMLSNVINEIEEFSKNVAEQLREALNNLPKPGEPPRKVNLTLSLSVPDMSELSEELRKLELYYGV